MRAWELASQADALERLAEEREDPGSAQEEPDPAGAQDGAAARLGEVVWAREKGWPAWPALVITRETARGLSTLRALLYPTLRVHPARMPLPWLLPLRCVTRPLP